MSGMMHTSILRRTLAPFTLIGLLALVAVLPAGRASGNTSAAQGSVTAAAVAPMARLDAAGGLSGEFFGSALALDGDLLAVGAHYADVNGVRDAGTVYLYARDTAVPVGLDRDQEAERRQARGRRRLRRKRGVAWRCTGRRRA